MEIKTVLPTRAKMNFSMGPGVTTSYNPSGQHEVARFTFNKDRIKTAIDRNDVAVLRDMSAYFFSASGEYRRLVSYYGSILANEFLLIPLESGIDRKKLEKEHTKVWEYLDGAAVKDVCGKAAVSVVRDGAYFGYEVMQGKNQSTVLPLPGKFCRSRFFVEGLYSLEFDFSYFDQFRGEEREQILASFPPEFGSFYNAYLADRQNARWALLDPKKSRVHMLEDGTPMLAPVFLDLLELEEFKAMEKAKARLGISKLITQKLPIDKDGMPTLLLEEAQELHRNVYHMISNPTKTVDVVTSFAEIQVLDLMDKNSKEQNDVEHALSMVYSTAGTPMVLFNAGNKSSSVGLALSVNVDENLMFPLLEQFSLWYTMRVKQITKTPFEIKFLEITKFNRSEKFKEYKEAALAGFPTKLAAMASIGFNQKQTVAMLEFENDFFGLIEKMRPIQTSHTQGAEAGPGREEKDGPLSDEGQKTKDGDKNANRG